MQSLVVSCSIIVIRRPTRRRYRCRNCPTVIFKKSAMNSISGRVTQIYPSPGPEQHPPHSAHSKCKPATYHAVLFFVPDFTNAVPKVAERSIQPPTNILHHCNHTSGSRFITEFHVCSFCFLFPFGLYGNPSDTSIMEALPPL